MLDVHRARIRSTARWAHNELTFSMLYAYPENFVLPFSHDEVVHGKGSMLDKMPGDAGRSSRTCARSTATCSAHPGKKLLFMGGEFGQWREWNHDASLDWHLLERPAARGAAALRAAISNRALPARAGAAPGRLRPGRLPVDRLQRQREQRRLVHPPRARPARLHRAVLNFTPVPRDGYRVGVPEAGPLRASC